MIMPLIERKRMATGNGNCDKFPYPPGATDHARRESPSSGTPPCHAEASRRRKPGIGGLSRQERQQVCDCTAPLDLDPATGKSRYRIASATVCRRCYELQRRYEFHEYSSRRRHLPSGPTVLGGLYHATLGKA
jgi:hypothetical protein